MRILIYALFMLIFTKCSSDTPKSFSEKALNDTLLSSENKTILWKTILEKRQNKKVFIVVWASWCRDCLESLPDLKKFQKAHPTIDFIFVSVDKSFDSWQNGIVRNGIIGEHYLLPKGMKKGDLVDFLNLRWIPRYLIVDENKKILLFKSTNITDEAILKVLK